MKALFFSIGTRGDIEPLLAIAQLLKEKKWEVICVFPEQFRPSIENLGIPFIGFCKEYLELMDGKEAKMFMSGRGSIFRRAGYLIKITRNGTRLSKKILNLQHEIQLAENPDRVFYHPKCNYSLLWGMANPGKSIMVSPVPGVAHPVRHVTILGDYGKTVNVLSVKLGNTIKAIMLKWFSKRYRMDYPGLKISIGAIKKAMVKKEKTFYSISRSLFPKPAYWPPTAHVVGFYEADKTAGWQPDERLLSFLQRYRKIVFITFGSMSNANPKAITRMIIDILKKHNVPAIINTSWGGLVPTGNCPHNIHFVSNIPYERLFPKMVAVVHHGGSGTTHTALKYGCPSLIIPHILDQFFWNNTIADRQLGPKGVSIKNLNETNFEHKLLDLLHNETYRRNAQLISEQMKTESRKEDLYNLIVD